MTRKLVILYVEDSLFHLYHSEKEKIGAVGDTLAQFIERMQLIGHEAFILPSSCKVEVLGEDKPIIQETGDFRFMVVNVDVGNMPPSRANEHLLKIKEEMSVSIPKDVKVFFFARSSEGRGSTIETYRL